MSGDFIVYPNFRCYAVNVDHGGYFVLFRNSLIPIFESEFFKVKSREAVKAYRDFIMTFCLICRRAHKRMMFIICLLFLDQYALEFPQPREEDSAVCLPAYNRPWTGGQPWAEQIFHNRFSSFWLSGWFQP